MPILTRLYVHYKSEIYEKELSWMIKNVDVVKGYYDPSGFSRISIIYEVNGKGIGGLTPTFENSVNIKNTSP